MNLIEYTQCDGFELAKLVREYANALTHIGPFVKLPSDEMV
jgi:hypothetical protein